MRGTVACAVMLLAVCAAKGIEAAPSEVGIMTREAAGGLPDRCVLEGVPRVGFYPKQSTSAPEDDPLPACLRAWLQFMGDDEDMRRLTVIPGDPWHHVHVFFMGTSGQAFRLVWGDDWEGGPCSTAVVMTPDPEDPFRWALRSVGYAYQLLFRSEYAREIGYRGETSDDEARYRRLIMDSIAAGRPVIVFGMIGPPEPNLVTGYDDRGETLIGWAFFQDDEVENPGGEFEPSGYFRKRGWFANTVGLLVIGEKGGRPAVEETYRAALVRGLGIMRRQEVRGRRAGFVAFEAWADALLQDEEFPAEGIEKLRRAYMAHFMEAGVLAEARAWGESFLRQAALVYPAAADELKAAGKCFMAEHDLVWAIWEFAGGNGVSDEHVRRFAQPGVRRRIVPLIRLAQEQDERAAAHLERALEVIGEGGS